KAYHILGVAERSASGDAMTWTVDQKAPLVLVMDHPFLFNTLSRLGFDPSFLRWVHMLYIYIYLSYSLCFTQIHTVKPLRD
uniref:Uncharacterized protein n=1 Tax=Scleropages formosus TaxID=113540 RepID=A0A8C9TBW1_SCLFO